MIKFCLILSLITLLKLSSSIDLRCSYNTNFHYSVLGRIYRCEIQNDFHVASPEQVIVKSINGSHRANMNDDLVTGLFSYSKSMKYVPKNMEKFFKNIKLIDIVNDRIKKIQQSDLKPFPQLVYCGFKDNEIQVLEAGLFDYNLELELVSFWNNRITQVGPNVFDHLTKLTWLYLEGNPCIDMKAANSRTGVLNLIQNITKNCSNSKATSDSTNEIEELKFLFKDLKAAHENGFKAMTETTEELVKKNQKLEKDLSEALEKIKDLESNFNLLESKISNLTENLASCGLC